MKDKIEVWFPNIGSDYINIDMVKTWQPKDIEVVGDVTFFTYDKTRLSINSEEFNKILNN